MARSLEEIIASDSRFKNIDINKAREYYNDALRSRNAKDLPELVVTTKSKKLKRKELEELQKQEDANILFNSDLSFQDRLNYNNYVLDKNFNKIVEDRQNLANKIEEYKNNKLMSTSSQNVIHNENIKAIDKNIRNSNLNAEDVNILADFLPIIGDIRYANDIKNDISNNNINTAIIGVLSMFAPSFLKNPIRRTIKSIKNNYRKFSRNLQHFNKFDYKYINLLNDAYITDTNEATEIFKKSLFDNSDYSDKFSKDIIRPYIKANLDKYHNKLNNNFLSRLSKLPNNELNRYFKNSQLSENHLSYNYFCAINDLDPKDIKSVRKFIDNQSYSIRGVYTKGDEDYIKFLTEADNSWNKDRRGADMFNSRGVYTSNSAAVKDKFNKAISDPNTTGYAATLFRDFDIPKNLSIEEQLQLLQDRIYEYDIINNLQKENIPLRIQYDKFRRENPDIYAWESPYFGHEVKQRSYVNSSEEPHKKVVDIVDLVTTSNNDVRKDRFSTNNNPTSSLFISQYPAPNEHNIERYTDIAYKYQNANLNEKGKQVLRNYKHKNNMDFEKRTHMDDELKRRFLLRNAGYSKIRRQIKDINRHALSAMLPIVTATTIASLAANSKHNTPDTLNYLRSLNDDDFKKEYDNIMKNKDYYKDNFIKYLENYKKKRFNE